MAATRGIPLQGERSAHDMTYADLHASDIEDATPLYHWTEAQLDAQYVRGASADDNVSDPPTDAELDTAFGTPVALGAGFVGILDDNSDDTDVYICYTSDTSWFYVKGTKAT